MTAKKKAKKRTHKKKAVKKKAATKKAVRKGSAKKVLAEAQKKRIRKAIQDVERKLRENYKNAVKISGKDWRKESKKYNKIIKDDVAKARKQIESEVKKNPSGAAVAAGVVGAIAGAFLMSRLRR